MMTLTNYQNAGLIDFQTDRTRALNYPLPHPWEENYLQFAVEYARSCRGQRSRLAYLKFLTSFLISFKFFCLFVCLFVSFWAGGSGMNTSVIAFETSLSKNISQYYYYYYHHHHHFVTTLNHHHHSVFYCYCNYFLRWLTRCRTHKWPAAATTTSTTTTT